MLRNKVFVVDSNACHGQHYFFLRAFAFLMSSIHITYIAPVNIAVVKYWGKRDSTLLLPVNSSLSGTLHTSCMRSETTVIATPPTINSVCGNNDAENTTHRMGTVSLVLNGKEIDLQGSERTRNVIAALREASEDYIDPTTNKVLVKKEDWKKWNLQIVSENNFPTAAGLASSASGFACLTQALARLYRVEGDISTYARQGSGSACRSVYGGWVKWQMGEKDDGTDSIAIQVADEHHWPEMRVLILVVNEGKKWVSSTSGMEKSVETSDLLKHRVKIVNARMERMEDAIKRKDFETFAVETMKDSNQFHAVCLDTYPPIFYMNDTSKKIVTVLHEINKERIKVAYTYDAGPNAVLYLLEKDVSDVLSILLHSFPTSEPLDTFLQDPMQLLPRELYSNRTIPASFEKFSNFDAGVKKILVATIGPGPTLLQETYIP